MVESESCSKQVIPPKLGRSGVLGIAIWQCCRDVPLAGYGCFWLPLALRIANAAYRFFSDSSWLMQMSALWTCETRSGTLLVAA